MGGVNLEDMKRLYCETRLHGLRRWWIRIFFYYLDVSILNAAILYGKANGEAPPNLFHMKAHLVEHILNTIVRKEVIPAQLPGMLAKHYLKRVFERNRRRRCTLYLDQGVKDAKTQSVCVGCDLRSGDNLPLCCGNQRDCWEAFHKMDAKKRVRVINDHEANQFGYIARNVSKRLQGALHWQISIVDSYLLNKKMGPKTQNSII